MSKSIEETKAAIIAAIVRGFEAGLAMDKAESNEELRAAMSELRRAGEAEEAAKEELRVLLGLGFEEDEEW